MMLALTHIYVYTTYIQYNIHDYIQLQTFKMMDISVYSTFLCRKYIYTVEMYDTQS